MQRRAGSHRRDHAHQHAGHEEAEVDQFRVVGRRRHYDAEDPAGIEAAAHRQRLPVVHPRQLPAQEDATDLAHEGNDRDQDDEPEIKALHEVGRDGHGDEEDRGEDRVGKVADDLEGLGMRLIDLRQRDADDESAEEGVEAEILGARCA